jgi:glyoxylase-like metal-dependent hydrolase (beta-lactamase superfamily II)
MPPLLLALRFWPLAARRFRHAIAAVVMGLAAPAHADELEGLQLGPHTYSVSGLPGAGAEGATIGFVITTTSVVVFDAVESALQAALLLDAIRQLTPKPISHVLLTHPRSGQADALAAWKAQGATLVARRAGQPAVAADRGSVLRADLWIEDSTDLLVGGTQIQAIVLAGTAGRIAYLLPEDSVLFVGDLAEPGRIPDLSTADAEERFAVLDELLKFKARVVVPGRGPAALEAVAGLQLERDYLTLLLDTMGAAARTAEPFDAAYGRADWSRFAALPQFATFNRANAAAAYQRLAAPPFVTPVR